MNWETGEWDVLSDLDVGIPTHPETSCMDVNSREQRRAYSSFGTSGYRRIIEAYLIDVGFIHYDQILLFDELGDVETRDLT